jgi:hypothetical protein
VLPTDTPHHAYTLVEPLGVVAAVSDGGFVGGNRGLAGTWGSHTLCVESLLYKTTVPVLPAEAKQSNA